MAKEEQFPWLLSDDCFIAGNPVVGVTAVSTKQETLSWKAGHAEREEGGSSTLWWKFALRSFPGWNVCRAGSSGLVWPDYPSDWP